MVRVGAQAGLRLLAGLDPSIAAPEAHLASCLQETQIRQFVDLLGQIRAAGTIKDILGRLKSEVVTLDLGAPVAERAASLLAWILPSTVTALAPS